MNARVFPLGGLSLVLACQSAAVLPLDGALEGDDADVLVLISAANRRLAWRSPGPDMVEQGCARNAGPSNIDGNEAEALDDTLHVVALSWIDVCDLTPDETRVHVLGDPFRDAEFGACGGCRKPVGAELKRAPGDSCAVPERAALTTFIREGDRWIPLPVPQIRRCDILLEQKGDCRLDPDRIVRSGCAPP